MIKIEITIQEEKDGHLLLKASTEGQDPSVLEAAIAAIVMAENKSILNTCEKALLETGIANGLSDILAKFTEGKIHG